MVRVRDQNQQQRIQIEFCPKQVPDGLVTQLLDRKTNPELDLPNAMARMSAIASSKEKAAPVEVIVIEEMEMMDVAASEIEFVRLRTMMRSARVD